MATAPEADLPAVESLPDHKPAFLRRVQIRGYKSIAFCDVTLEPLTILVGRNASGKSNFLDALGFLKDTFETNLVDAVRKHGGWSSIINRQCQGGGTISFEIHTNFSSPGTTYVFETQAVYSIVIKTTEHGVPFIAKEDFVSRGDGGHSDVKFSRSGLYNPVDRAVEYQLSFTHFNMKIEEAPSPRSDIPWLAATGRTPYLFVADRLRYSGFYNFHTGSIREPQKPDPGALLSRTGSNLASAIRSLDDIDPAAIRRIRQYLASIVHNVLNFEVLQSGERERIQFLLRGRNGNSTESFDAASMSDGTLRSLAALLAAFQIHLPGGPGIVAIEEPETSLHPAAVHALVDALDEATLRTQILLTSHSSEMLDNPTIKPENIRVVQMIDGQTVIAPVDEASVEIVRDKLGTLGSLERDNLLEPHLDEVDRVKRILEGKESPR